MPANSKQDAIVVSAATAATGVGAAMLFGGVLWGVGCAAVVAVVNAVAWRKRGVRAVLRVANCALFALGLTLSVFFARNYFGRVTYSVAEREGASPLFDRKRFILRELRTVYHLTSPRQTDESTPPPAAVLLHGNAGTGMEIINDTKWDGIARDKGWVLIAPTSPGQTWGEDAHQVILASLSDAAGRVRFDRARVLLTGRSDGATWCYNVGLRYPDVFQAIAPASGTFWPMARLYVYRSKPVAAYIYHSINDHIFPVAQARSAAETLRSAGHAVKYFEDGAGGHEYSPQQARRIAEWFEKLPRRNSNSK